MSSIFQGSQSSVIKMTLTAKGKTYKVIHSAPNHLILADPDCLEPCQATFAISIDGDITEYPFEIRSVVNGKRVEARPVGPQASWSREGRARITSL